jgi:hypothetical protein
VPLEYWAGVQERGLGALWLQLMPTKLEAVWLTAIGRAYRMRLAFLGSWRASMIDLQKRKEARELLLGLINGSITNDEFEIRYPGVSQDRALPAIFERVWFLWDDRYEHSLTGQNALMPDQRAMVLRCIAFLGSAVEYQWPKGVFMASLPLILCRLLRLRNTAKKLENKRVAALRVIGDMDVWPFLSAADYAHIAANP